VKTSWEEQCAEEPECFLDATAGTFGLYLEAPILHTDVFIVCITVPQVPRVVKEIVCKIFKLHSLFLDCPALTRYLLGKILL